MKLIFTIFMRQTKFVVVVCSSTERANWSVTSQYMNHLIAPEGDLTIATQFEPH